MLQKAIAVAKLLALTSLTALFLTLGMLVAHVDRSVSSFQTTIQPLVQKAALDLDDIHHLVLESGLTAMEARKASAEERTVLPGLTKQAQQSLQDMDALMVAARQTTDGLGVSQQQIAQSTTAAMATLNDTVRDAQPVLSQAQQAIAELQTVAKTVNNQASDPAIADTLHHLDATMSSVQASAEDLQGEVHSITHPGWAHRAWGWALDIGHVFNPL